MKNVSVLAAVGVDQEGYREVLGVSEGAKEDKASWLVFLRHLKRRGLQGVRLAISDACLRLVEVLHGRSVLPDTNGQRCVVHFYRNVFRVVPKGRVTEVAAMLKAIHAQEDRTAANEKAPQMVAKLETMKLPKAAGIVHEGIGDARTSSPGEVALQWSNEHAFLFEAPRAIALGVRRIVH